MPSSHIPPDTYPDDFDTPAYANYHPRLSPGLGLTLRRTLPRLILGLATLIVLVAAVVAAALILPEDAPQVVVITALPSATPIGDVGGDFPATVPQSSVQVPARVDETFAPNDRHAYRFFAAPNLTWTITVTPDRTFDPVLTLYSPDGVVMQIDDDGGGGLSSRISFTPTEAAQYAILIESAKGGASSGGYTLQILPS